MGRMVTVLRSAKRAGRGQAAVEMAMTFPVVFVIIIAVMELGFAFNAYTTVTAAARIGARAGAVYLPDPTSSQTVNDSNRESGTGVTPPYLDNVRDSIAARLAPLRFGSSYFDKAADVNINYTPSPIPVDNRDGDLINVTVVYHYRPITGVFGNWTINMQSQSSERIE